MRTRGTASSVGSASRSGQPNFLFGLLGKEAETYADAYLVSEEGKRFPIVRSLLAMKCAFFKEKFFPGSIERNSHSDVGVDGSDDFVDDMESDSGDNTQGTTTNPEQEKSTEDNQSPEIEPNERATVENTDTPAETAEKEVGATTEPSLSFGKDESSTMHQALGEQEITAEDVTKEANSESPRLGGATHGSFQVNGNMKPRYPMPFPTILLRQVVEFIYTDSVKFLDNIEAATKPWRGAPDMTNSSSAPSCSVVSHIVELSRAADYVQLKELCLRCCIILRMVVKAKRSTACAALGAIRRQKDNPFFLNKMAGHVVKYISGDVKKSFAVVPCTKIGADGQEATSPCFGAYGLCTVMHLNSAALEEIICALTRGFSDEYMLQVVYFWATGGKRLSSLHTSTQQKLAGDVQLDSGDNEAGYFDAEGEPNAMTLSAISSSKELVDPSHLEKDIRPRGISLVAPKMKDPESAARFAEGKSMIAKFMLSDMNPSFLHEYVELSGLVDRETLYNVYRFRALSGPRFTRLFSMKKKPCPPRCDQ